MDDPPVGLGSLPDSHAEFGGLGDNPPTELLTPADPKRIAAGTPYTVDAGVDVDTCRICRGEATDTEPLFFPCKCSGSIKYVHQDCLMEWLSHSQKKHCELCKTAFRFTKLYSPDMPKHLPFHIFIHHMTRYLLRNFLVWLRAALVTSVWLGWLPYLMRSIWSFLFWISDEGFTSSIALLDPRNASLGSGPTTVDIAVEGSMSTMCPSTPLLASAMTPASAGELMDELHPRIMNIITKPLNMSTAHSWLRMLFGLPVQPQVPTLGLPNNASATLFHRMTKTALSDPRRSILSDVAFLNRITRNAAVNRIIIHVLEGQIITLLAIICFILIILVRDYVVQQQPEINMRAAFPAENAENLENAENDMAQPAPPTPPAQPVQPAPPTPHLDIPVDDPEPREGSQGWAESADQTDDELRDRGLRPTEPLPDIIRPNLRQRPMVGMGRRPILNIPDQIQTSRGSSPVSPRSPRGFLDEGQSGFLREPSPLGVDRDGSPGRTMIGEYVRIYRAADGDNDRIREIINLEGLDEAQFGRLLHNRSASPSSMVAEKACSDSSSWTCAGSDDENEATGTAALDKGKGRAEGVRVRDGQEQAPAPSGSRPSLIPRARSDGPQSHEDINPLANNNWSFSNLPPNETSQLRDLNAIGFTFDYTTPEIEIGFVPDSDDRSARPSITSLASINQPFIQPQSPSEAVTTADYLASNQAVPNNAPHPTAINDGRDTSATVPSPETAPRRPAVPPPQPNTIVGRVAEFMWGDVPPADGNGANQEAVDIFGDNQNPPFMHGGHGMEDDSDTDDDEQDQIAPDVVEAAVAAGLDPEAVEDAEDFDGIMELIGMRGPIVGLFQNAVFCAFLVSISIFLGVFVPYNIGRVAAWILANPTRLLKIAFSLAKFMQDTALLAAGLTITFIFNILEGFRILLVTNYGKQILRTLRLDAKQFTDASLGKIASNFMPEAHILSTSDIRTFSAISHLGLLELKGNIRYCILLVGDLLVYVFGGDYLTKWSGAVEFWTTAGSSLIAFVKAPPLHGIRLSALAAYLNSPAVSPPLNPALAYWDAQDRSWAILLGYTSLTLLAALYLSRGTTFSTGQAAQEWEASIIDALSQASGVMKVILIISIEMLVFPLYCGLLLDFALLPLFEQTTLKSRLLFAYNYPLTSIFVHWFIGTGYMFHFALFVSMCRKIMRKGVLYFIRDPDDPEFHPVRDVLERNVTTQLRKILFSAFVYGALVVICLGGVVWGLSLTLPTVLPIHYTYNEPVLEFPVDLLFCNFLMPLAVKFFKPSDGLHTMYTWWFRQCARALRLTWFLFGERRVEEEGRLVDNNGTSGYNFSSWRSMFLGVNADNQVVPKTWGSFFDDGDSKPASKISREDMSVMNINKKALVKSGRLVPDGRFVRSPASDQAKITKGRSVFTLVSEREMIQTYDSGRPEIDGQLTNQFQVVYVPPWFRARISIFIMSIWIFAAVTGVGSTILPLVLGRRIFKALVPPHIRTNDIYAFSIGVYVLSSASYLAFHLHSAYDTVREWTMSIAGSVIDRNALRRVGRLAYRTLKLTYAYSMLLLVFPILITALVEMYVLIPLHTYMGTGGALRLDGGQDGHTVRIIQAWTLGILYLKLGSRALTLYGGRPSDAVRAVLRQGWLEPDISVLTRAFVIPGFIASLVMLLIPPMFAWATLHWVFDSTTAVSYEMQVSAYRMAYPLTAGVWAALVMLRRVLRVFEGWQIRIRDEAYLMGERLHNFTGTAAKATAWRGSSRMQNM
ncbi:putative E3 ubiquitin-protein ligase MARCH6 [Rosellinia necatrix]|uniref:RING-type E3 ubiquitin transferase n=1 Tax=Rosellinia necatrix TaxID=77044 RepID=A0A1W2TN65_ROSNE|nr:putative E3 ubiquitin-protein ligase MARCH6 [Rosellinia necatrix]